MVFTQKNRTFPHPVNYTRAMKHGTKNYSLSKMDAFLELWELKQKCIKKYMLAPPAGEQPLQERHQLCPQ